MADEQLRHLVRMANQIALNLGEQRDPDDAARRTGDHLHRFWTVDMRRQLVEYWQGGGDDLSPAAARAAEQLAGELPA
jgi:formate dehydrogenase subunit delta